MRSTARNWVRYTTTFLIMATVVGLIVIGFDRSQRMARPVGNGEVPLVDAEADDPAVGIYTGFEYVESVAGRAIFALRSIKTLGKSSGWHEIEGVQLQLYDQGVPGPVVTAAGASFNIETRDAELRGPVHVSFPSGATLTTQSGEFEASSRRFITDSEVVFMNGETVVEAGRASYSMEDDRIVLTDDALMTSGGTSLRASRIDYQRAARTIDFPEGCRIVQGGSLITAPHAVVELAEEDGPPQRVSMEGGVSARRRGDGDGGGMEAWAETVVAERDARGNWQLDASTSRDWVSVVMRLGESYYERQLQTRVLRGVVGPDGPLNLRAEGGACIDEIPFEGEPRRAEAATARVWFENGKATDMQLEQDVIIRGEGIEARGYRARMSAAAGVTMLHGDPSGLERALVVSERGRVACDQVVIHDEEGRLEARGKVQGMLSDVTILGGRAEGEAPAPAHFAGDLLEITDSGANYRLREGARLWQGHRLLIADEVTYREERGTVDAAGHVRATFPADQVGTVRASGDDIVVVARSLTYDRSARRAVFRGNVRYSDPEYVLSATELDATFDSDNQLSEIVANGDVELRELGSGRTMVAQHATRDVAAGVVHATGSPVRLTDVNGTTVSSTSLTWNQADGSVTVAGSTETIYYPEEEP